MKSKEQYYDQVLENRKLAATPEVIRCTCPHTLCDWHGRCKECVALHRHHNDHVPYCLQPLIREKIQALVGVVEMTAVQKESTPLAYRQYVKARDQEEQQA